jgi:hypothetical protein
MSKGELNDVEIQFLVDWYDGPLSGVASHGGATFWFEAEPGAEAKGFERKLFLYALAEDELTREQELNRLFEERAKGKPVEEWPPVLRERELELPTAYAATERRGWFVAR